MHYITIRPGPEAVVRVLISLGNWQICRIVCIGRH